jgi:hypothetical protein
MQINELVYNYQADVMALRSAHCRHLFSINAIKRIKLGQRAQFSTNRTPRLEKCKAANILENTSGDGGVDANSVLFLSPVWPERSSSAAGVRSCDLISSFQERNYAVSYASPSTPNEHTSLIQASGVTTIECPPNNEDTLTAILRSTRPSIVIFDRFYAEEMFSFRVKDILPDALRILDMQDIHFLREGRQLLAKHLPNKTASSSTPQISIQDILNHRPDATFPSLLRELASIYRSDLTLVCSPVELKMLQEDYSIPSEMLTLAPFFAPPSPHAASPVPWSERQHFLMIGNFRHPPNFDSVKWTCEAIWPLVRKKLGNKAELHLYGSYAPQAAAELNNPVRNIMIDYF